jgi:hypothetical protein
MVITREELLETTYKILNTDHGITEAAYDSLVAMCERSFLLDPDFKLIWDHVEGSDSYVYITSPEDSDSGPDTFEEFKRQCLAAASEVKHDTDKDFIVELYELFVTEYRIRAKSEAAAVKGVCENLGERVDGPGEFICIDDERGVDYGGVRRVRQV